MNLQIDLSRTKREGRVHRRGLAVMFVLALGTAMFLGARPSGAAPQQQDAMDYGVHPIPTAPTASQAVHAT